MKCCNNHLPNIDEMEHVSFSLDEMGIDEMGLDEMDINRVR